MLKDVIEMMLADLIPFFILMVPIFLIVIIILMIHNRMLDRDYINPNNYDLPKKNSVLKKTVLIILGVISILIIILLIFNYIKKEASENRRLEKLIDDACEDYYFGVDWESPSVSIEHDSKTISVYFNEDKAGIYGDLCEYSDELTNIFISTIDLIYGYDKYYDYEMEIAICEGSDQINLTNIDSSLKNIRMYCHDDMSLNELATYFSYVSDFKLSDFYYDDISEIEGFDSLKKLQVDTDFSEDDRRYILSIYPECEIYTIVFDDYEQ